MRERDRSNYEKDWRRPECFFQLISWMWLVTEHYVTIRQNDKLEQFFRQIMSVIFNHCTHGGMRPKKSTRTAHVVLTLMTRQSVH